MNISLKASDDSVPEARLATRVAKSQLMG